MKHLSILIILTSFHLLTHAHSENDFTPIRPTITSPEITMDYITFYTSMIQLLHGRNDLTKNEQLLFSSIKRNLRFRFTLPKIDPTNPFEKKRAEETYNKQLNTFLQSLLSQTPTQKINPFEATYTIKGLAVFHKYDFKQNELALVLCSQSRIDNLDEQRITRTTIYLDQSEDIYFQTAAKEANLTINSLSPLNHRNRRNEWQEFPIRIQFPYSKFFLSLTPEKAEEWMNANKPEKAARVHIDRYSSLKAVFQIEIVCRTKKQKEIGSHGIGAITFGASDFKLLLIPESIRLFSLKTNELLYEGEMIVKSKNI